MWALRRIAAALGTGRNEEPDTASSDSRRRSSSSGNRISRSSSMGSENVPDTAQGTPGSLCDRICQFPQYLGVEGEQGAFVREPGTSMAVLRVGSTAIGNSDGTGAASGLTVSGVESGASASSSSLNISSFGENSGKEISIPASPLFRQEQAENNNLRKYLLSDTGPQPGAVSPSSFQQVGTECSICSINQATHFALPCHHSACKACFSRWLSTSKLCMTCQAPINNIQRYPLSVLPLTLYEKIESSQSSVGGSSIKMNAVLVDQALERSIRSMLIVKDELGKIVDDLHTIESHLIGVTRPDPGAQRLTVDILTSVLAVEHSSAVETLRAYEAVFKRGGRWDTMDQEFLALIQSIGAFSKALDTDLENQREKVRTHAAPASTTLDKSNSNTALIDKFHEGQPDEKLHDLSLADDENDTEAPKGTVDGARLGADEQHVDASTKTGEGEGEREEYAEALVTFETIVANTSILAQWAFLQRLLATAGSKQHLVPGIVRVMQLMRLPNQNSDVDLKVLAERTMSAATKRDHATNSRIHSLLVPEARVMVERLRSMQE